MYTIVNLYSEKKGEILDFLNKFYNGSVDIPNDLKWEKSYNNPIEIAEIIGVFIDNSDKYKINMWISIDEGTFVNVTNNNADSIIKYLYERFPY